MSNPEIKHLWKYAVNLKTEEEMRENSQLKSHGNNVFEAINAGINSLDKVEALNNMLVELGDRHNSYGAKIVHFPVNFTKIFLKKLINNQNLYQQIIGKALMETIQEALGPKFTPEVSFAWNKTVNYFVQEMSIGMHKNDV